MRVSSNELFSTLKNFLDLSNQKEQFLNPKVKFRLAQMTAIQPA